MLISRVRQRIFTKGFRVQVRPSGPGPLPLCSTASPKDLIPESGFPWLEADFWPTRSVAEGKVKCTSACAPPAGTFGGPACLLDIRHLPQAAGRWDGGPGSEQPALALRWRRAPWKEGDAPSVRTADTQLGLAANPWPRGAEPQVTHWNSSVDRSCWDTGGQRASLAPLRPLLPSTWRMGWEHESVGLRRSPLTHLTRNFNSPPSPPSAQASHPREGRCLHTSLHPTVDTAPLRSWI